MCLSLNQAIYQQLASLVQGMVNKKGVKNLKTEILTVSLLSILMNIINNFFLFLFSHSPTNLLMLL